MSIGMMGKIQVTPKWADYTVQRQDGHQWRGFRVRRGRFPPKVHSTAGGEGGTGQE